MKKIIQKISAVLQVVLMAPVKLPGKALNIIKYIALGLGVVETVLEDREHKDAVVVPPDEAGKTGVGIADMEDDQNGRVLDDGRDKAVLLNKDLNNGGEVRDEIE